MEKKKFSFGGNAALTLYVSSLAGCDLGLAMGRRGCSIGVTCPNDSSSYTRSYSDSSSVTSGINLVREIGNFRTLHDTDRGTKSQTMSFIGARVFYTVLFFHFQSHFAFVLSFGMEMQRRELQLILTSTVLTHLTTEKRLLCILT